ncbi:MAG: hypothetical protein ACRDH0_10355 [Actinomycetota bacterium]
MTHTTHLPPRMVVIFGASGDLAHRKLLPAFFSVTNLALERPVSSSSQAPR